MFLSSEGGKWGSFSLLSAIYISLTWYELWTMKLIKASEQISEAISPVAPQVQGKKKSPLHTHKVSNLISKPILPVPDIVWFHISTTDGNDIQANYLQETEQEVEVSSKN